MNCNYKYIINRYDSLRTSKDKLDYVYFDRRTYLEFRYYKNKKILIDIYIYNKGTIFTNIHKS